MKPGQALLRLLWRRERRLLTSLVFVTFIAGVAPAAMAYFGKRIIDIVERVQRDGGWDNAAFYWLGAEAAAMLAMTVSARAALVLKRMLGIKVAEHLREQIIDDALALNLEAMEDPDTADRIALARRQAPTRPTSFLTHVLGVGRGLLVLVASSLLLIAISPIALLVVIGSGIPSFVHQLRFARQLHRLATDQIQMRREQGYLENVLTREGFAKEVRALGFGPALRKRFSAITESIYDAEAKLARKEALGGSYWAALGTIAVYGAYVTVVWSALEGTVSLGEMTMALVVFRQTQRASESLLTDLAGLGHDRLFLEDLMSVVHEGAAGEGAASDDTPTPIAEPARGDAPSSTELGLRFDDVHYRYPDTPKDALSGVSFHVAPGQILGLVGHNGSGKSTLIKLALGLIEPSEGRILLDGKGLSEWDRDTLRDRFAVAFQDFARFKLPLREVIELGDLEADDEAIQNALKLAGAGFVRQLPDGLDTRLGRSFPGGVDLSGGEWQRLALARAFVREGADLWVLDEPTAALDPKAEARLFEVLRESERTVLVAAHRLSAMRDADEILLLKKGKVAERGDHETLMEGGGQYATLFALQAASYQ